MLPNTQLVVATREMIDLASIPATNHPTVEAIDFSEVNFYNVVVINDLTNIVSIKYKYNLIMFIVNLITFKLDR